ncbi:MAG: SPFH domain-containing protein, partial [Deinococcus sp.]|nr:SPFH domain-containing protein [Deinococcus sp.]
MGIFNFIKSQFIEVIEWLDPTQNTLVYRFPVQNQEIKMGAKLTVRESQAAVFVNEGTIADVFQPGLHTLSTQNLPIMTKLRSWPYGFTSPFKAEVYFVNTKQFTDLKWGTANPIMLRDSEFGVVRLRAFGVYSLRVTDPAKLIREVAGTNARFQTEDIEGQLKRALISSFSDALAEAKIPALDLASKYDELGQEMRQKLVITFGEYGLDITKFVIENISLPPEVEAALDKRTSMGIVGDLGRYTQFQAATALEKGAAAGGGVAAGAQVAAGLAMGQAIASTLSQAQPAPRGATCPKCGAQVASGAKFCGECGATMAPATAQCVGCGATIPHGAKFCSECGAPQQAKRSCPQCQAEVKPGAK